MSEQIERAELVGFLFGANSMDTDATLVPLNGGLTVLYGLNGAGKTRTQESLRSFWAGCDAPNVFALVRLPHLNHDQADLRYGQAHWWQGWARATKFAADYESNEWVNSHAMEEILRAFFVETTIAETSDESDLAEIMVENRGAGLLEEWETQRLLLVGAIGTPAVPRWRSAPALVTGDGRRFSNAAAELFERVHSDVPYDAYDSMSFVRQGGFSRGRQFFTLLDGEAPTTTLRCLALQATSTSYLSMLSWGRLPPTPPS